NRGPEEGIDGLCRLRQRNLLAQGERKNAMKPSINPSMQLGLTAACFSLLLATFFSGLSVPATAQAVQKQPAGEAKNPPQSSNTNAPSKAAQSDPKATQATDKSVL